MNDLQVDDAIRYLKQKDKHLGRVIDRIGPIEPRRHKGSGFQALVSIIVGQQLSGKAAQSIFARLLQATGGRTIKPESLAKLTDKQLRAAGLSNAKVRSVRDLLRCIDEGLLKVNRLTKMSDEEVFEAVTQVKGLGPWSAQMYLMFSLGRPDVFSAGDLGLRKAIVNIYGVDAEAADFEGIAQRWRPYRTVACWYLWRSLANEPAIAK